MNSNSTGELFKSLRFYLSQRFFFMLAFQMRSVAVGWQVYELTRRPLDLGLVGLMQFLPAAGLSLIAGQMADRYPRKRIVLITQCTDFLCSLLLFALSVTGQLSVFSIYGLLFTVGVSRAFANAAGQSMLPSLVPEAQFPRAAAWNSSMWQLAVIIGPAIGGLLYGMTSNPSTVYFAVTLCGFLAFILMYQVPVKHEMVDKGPITWETLSLGVRYVCEKKIILGAISMDLFAVLLGGAVALLPAYASDILHVGPSGLGLLRSAPGIGAALTSVVLAFFPLKTRVGPKMFFCVALFGICTVLFGVSHDFYLSLVCLAVLGAADLVSVIVRSTLVQMFTPPQMRGRVSAVNLVFIGASNELGEFESGLTAAWWGLVPAVVIGGLGTCAVVLLWAYLFPDLFKLDRFQNPAT